MIHTYTPTTQITNQTTCKKGLWPQSGISYEDFGGFMCWHIQYILEYIHFEKYILNHSLKLHTVMLETPNNEKINSCQVSTSIPKNYLKDKKAYHPSQIDKNADELLTYTVRGITAVTKGDRQWKSSIFQYWYPGTDLVQGPYRDLAYIIRDVFPGGALWVAGGHTLPVPQVTWAGNSHIRHMIRICLTTNISIRHTSALPFSSTV